MSIETGQYIIVNVWQHTLAYLPDQKNGTPVTGNLEQKNNNERWSVTKLANGNYTMKNVGANMFAVAGAGASAETAIKGSSTTQQWVIRETRVKGQFNIATTDTGLFWGLVNSQRIPITLDSRVSDNRNAWIFKKVQPIPPVQPVQPVQPPPGMYNPGGGPQFGPDVPIPTWGR